MKPCTQCGRCCTNPSFMGTMSASSDDVQRWIREGRGDILQYADVIGASPSAEDMGFGFADLWFSPITGHDLPRCPFVRKIRNEDRYVCRIYETRPAVCREFPWNIGHMQYVDCEMLEDGDTDEDVAHFMNRQNEEQT